ncbi:hypothetical protein BDV34DRAFT_95759 [Aspergillus parasiticus]|uniref:Uncharacterized protein n=1 Tax=Aspergillus parasiticus TaxID=5067 RepID=A0A5N6DLD4_ASPPA|nr:hypothetical protein BDV34DRAFT_95759 [Aspergillus parasiticus]
MTENRQVPKPWIFPLFKFFLKTSPRKVRSVFGVRTTRRDTFLIFPSLLYYFSTGRRKGTGARPRKTHREGSRRAPPSLSLLFWSTCSRTGVTASL